MNHLKWKAIMNYRYSKNVIIFSLSLICKFSIAQYTQPFIKARNDAPNILFICSDQQRWNTIGALGNPYVHTPNLDKLVKEGVSFTKAHCQSTVCTPSRASFMTGMYPSTALASKNGASKWPEEAPLISTLLKDAGYECGMAGKLHLSTAMAHRPEIRPKDDGFSTFWNSHSPYQGGSANDYIKWHKDRNIDILALKEKYGYVPVEYHQTTWIADRAIDFINEKREWPWFFNLNIYDPHGPFDPPKEYVEKYDVEKLPGPWVNNEDLKQKSKLNDILFQSKPKKFSDLENKKRQALYWAQIDLIDENIGRLLEALEKSDQLDNTIIVFTSDHGEMLGDHGLTGKGCRFYEGLVRVPLVFWFPSEMEEDIQSDALVELIDIAPTLLDFAGIDIPEKMQGKSLLNILNGDANPNYHRDFVRCEFYDALFPRPDVSQAFATMLRDDEFKIVNYHGTSEGELFDMVNDPMEFSNLWNDPQYSNVKMDLMKRNFDETVKAINTGPQRLARY